MVGVAGIHKKIHQAQVNCQVQPGEHVPMAWRCCHRTNTRSEHDMSNWKSEDHYWTEKCVVASRSPARRRKTFFVDALFGE